MSSIRLSIIRQNQMETLRVTIDKLPRYQFINQGNNHAIKLQTPKTNITVVLIHKKGPLLANNEPVFREGSFILRRIEHQGQDMYLIRFNVNLNQLIRKMKRETYPILFVSDHVKVFGKLSGEYIKKKREQFKKKEIRNRFPYGNIRNEAGPRVSHQSSTEKMERIISQNVTAERTYERQLKAKKIYVKNPLAKRRCANCINFSNGNCAHHDVKVSENHYCRNFCSYITYLGGGFSPR